MKTFDEFYEDTKIISESTYKLDISDMPHSFIKQYQDAAKSKGIKFFSGRQPDGSRGSGFHPGEHIRFEGEYTKLKHFVVNSLGETPEEFDDIVEAKMVSFHDMTPEQQKAYNEIEKTNKLFRVSRGPKGSIDIWLANQNIAQGDYSVKPAYTIDKAGKHVSWDMNRGGY